MSADAKLESKLGSKLDTVAEAVTRYTERGFRVVPLYGVTADGYCLCGNPLCKPRDHGKHEPPETDGQWKDGKNFTAADFSGADNVGLAMGPWKAGRWLVALDLDGTTDPGNFFQGLPPTLTQDTPRGRHLVYTVAEYTPLGNWVDIFRTKQAGFSCDLRYARGRIVVAPSSGATGAYRWAHWVAPAPLPESALRVILAQRRSHGQPVTRVWDRGSKRP